jgi:hypothetical protein
VTAIDVSPGAGTLASIGETLQLAASVRQSGGGSASNQTVTLAVASGGSAASVSSSGLVTALGNGTATITASQGSVSGSATVTVAQRPSAVTISDTSRTVTEGDADFALSASAVDALGQPLATGTTTWSSDDESVATVSGGTVTPVGEGTATITATVSANGATATAAATVRVIGILRLSAQPLLPAVVGSPFDDELGVTGGVAPYAFALTGGALPAGMSLDAATGVVSGTSGVAGTTSFTVEVSSADGQTVSSAIDFSVADVLGRWVDESGAPITSAAVGDRVSFQLCYHNGNIAAFQATLTGFAAQGTVVDVGDLDSSLSGTAPVCAGTSDVLNAGFTASGTSEPITALVVSNAVSAGSGPAGILSIALDLTAGGTLLPALSGILGSDFNGTTLSMTPGIYPLVVN